MSAPTGQNFGNHTRLDPPYHMFVLPVAAINVLVTIWNLFRSPSWGSGWLVILGIVAAVAILKIRTYALRVQDRVIRLEERLRLSQLLPEPLRVKIGDLTEAQLIALRFASDAEIPTLVEKTLAGTMLPRDIKQAAVNWRPDYFRV